MISDGSITVSIVVACRNEIAHIRRFLDSLFAQEMSGLHWEAVIADGMSSDGTREVLDEYAQIHREVRIVSNPGRIVSTGLNMAIRAARGRYILRFDAHSYYSPDYCRKSIETLESTGADNAGGPARTRVNGILERAIAAAYHSRFSTGGAHFHDETFEGWVDTVPYGCWRKETLERVGMFDEALVRNQDDELNLRIVRAGGRIWQSPAIVSWYSPRSTLSTLFKQYFQYGFWKVMVIRKHRVPGSWRHLVPITFVISNIILLAGIALAAATRADVFLTFSALWLTMLGAYMLALLAASVLAARRAGWETLLYLPVVFAAYHLSYGVGFLAGLCVLFKHTTVLPPDSVFSRISR